jgi:hypothetical protein
MLQNTIKDTSKDTIKDIVEADEYQAGQQVELVIKTMTDLGYKAIVDGKYWGVLYYNEVFQELEKNQEVLGFIKQIRPDGKLDLTLYKTGHHDAKDIGSVILADLKAAGGFLPLTSKTEADEIYDTYGVSKKKFKMALGGLYKQRLITIEDDGIRLCP